ncbi:helix-turn-helix transcriptional regulator [Paenibacillus sp. GYB003]|uniref:helix-turn-helix transcriptional regulator n=1 Tax=Paenibacillus sp. GYB003 TaxID=2994392 RepID=UPI002F96AFF9
MGDMQRQLIQDYLTNANLRLSVAKVDKVSRNWRFLNMRPSYNALYFIREGEGWIKIDDREYYPAPGQLVLMPAGSLHSISVVSDNTYRKYWCHFTAVVETFQLFQLIDIPHVLDVPDERHTERLFVELIAAYRSREWTAPLKRKAVLFELIRHVLDLIPEQLISVSVSPKRRMLNTILQYIEGNIAENVTVEQLAGLLHYNPNYFIRFFKAEMNMTPMQYIAKVRVEKAKRLLLSTDSTLAEIGRKVGLEVHYLSRVFKKYSNMSPGEFRNRNRLG